jgi:hypothetical protein
MSINSPSDASLPPPSFEDDEALILADLDNTIETYIGGQRVHINLSPVSVFTAFARAVALIGQYLYRLSDQTKSALQIDTSTGTDLVQMGKLVGLTKEDGAAGISPVRMGVNAASGTDIIIPAGRRVSFIDQTRQPSLLATLLQAPDLPAGQAGLLSAGNTSTWASVQATFRGVAGNFVPGQVNGIVDTIQGIDWIDNPAAPDPPAPTVTASGTNNAGTAYEYSLVWHGYTGRSLQGPSTFFLGNNPLSGTHSNVVSFVWPDGVTRADILLKVGGVWTIIVSYFNTAVGPGTTGTFADTGAALNPRLPYTLPTVNDTQVGTGGLNDEGDDAFRARIPLAFAAAQTGTVAAVKSAVSIISGVHFVSVVDAVPGGSPAPGTFRVYVEPAVHPLAADIAAEVGDAIDAKKANGSVSVDTGGVAAPFGIEITRTTVDVAYTFSVIAGQDAALLVPQISAALIAQFDTLDIGDGLYVSDFLAAIKSVDGVLSVPTFSFHPSAGPQGGTTVVLGNVTGAAGILYGIGSESVTFL